MRLLVIEDKVDDVRGILDHADEKGWENKRLDFQDAIPAIDEYDPDVIVLDMKDDETQDEQCGGSIFNLIWKKKFRPTIVFSGLAESFVIDDPEIEAMAKEPLFIRIAKGDEDPVIEKLDYLEDIVPSISRLRRKLNTALIASANAIGTIKKASEQMSEDVQDYLFSNRITQFLQAPAFEQTLPTLVHYIYPPMGEHLLVGDILQKNEDGTYVIVLTPSCDMARAEDETKILVAHSADFSSIHDSFDEDYHDKPTKYEKRKKQMVSKMNQGFSDAKLYLPSIEGVIPNLCFNMKDIDVVKLGDIASNADKKTEAQKWVRLTSLASPYRERATWAYLSTACRPGVPTIDADSWVDSIYK